MFLQNDRSLILIFKLLQKKAKKTNPAVLGQVDLHSYSIVVDRASVRYTTVATVAFHKNKQILSP